MHTSRGHLQERSSDGDPSRVKKKHLKFKWASPVWTSVGGVANGIAPELHNAINKAITIRNTNRRILRWGSSSKGLPRLHDDPATAQNLSSANKYSCLSIPYHSDINFIRILFRINIIMAFANITFECAPRPNGRPRWSRGGTSKFSSRKEGRYHNWADNSSILCAASRTERRSKPWGWKTFFSPRNHQTDLIRSWARTVLGLI